MLTSHVHAVCARCVRRTRARAGARGSGAARRLRQCACAARASQWSAAGAAGLEAGRRGLRGDPRSPGRWQSQARCGPRRPTTDLQVGPPGCVERVGASGPPGGRGGPAASRAGQRLWSAPGGDAARCWAKRPSPGLGSTGRGIQGLDARRAGGRGPSQVA